MDRKNLSCFDPRECISGKAMRLNRIIAKVFRSHLQPFNVTNSQLSILFILSKIEDLNQKKLSEIATLEKSSLNRNLNRLVEEGMVTKEFFPIIKITDKGLDFVDDVIPTWRQAMDEIESLLGKEGIIAMDTLMKKVSP